ncbi:EAL domain-containing protein [Fulvimarina sp. MAC3]|uniref:putative bifunctional diguanylate cyclase/phosphodiesterase n=1 Tax=Fulvimarina sp. MAC3 TaxID=3148887 RepID=UPI0031FD6BE8
MTRLAGDDPRSAKCRDTRDKVRLDQIDLAMRLAPFTLATGVSVSEIVCLYFWQDAPFSYILALQATIVTLAYIGFNACLDWQKKHGDASAAAIGSMQQRLILVSGIGGLTLATIPVTLFVDADPNGRLLIASTCAGLIATGICIGFVPAAGLLFSGCIIAGSFITLMSVGESFYAVIAILLAIYSCFIFATIVQISRLASLRATAQIDLDHQREVSSLLLKEFEQNSSDWLWEIDAKGLIRSPSKRFAEVLRTDRDALASSSFEAIIAPEAGDLSANEAGQIIAAIKARRAFNQVRIPMRIGAQTRWWSLTGKPIFNREDRFLGFRGMGSDITLQTEYVTALDKLANHDALTKLPNRHRFEALVSKARLGSLEGSNRSGYAVFLLDLDRFKQINDTFGHAVGDELLKEIGARLDKLSGPDLIVSRFAGDEFALLSMTTDRARNSEIAKDILDRLQEPFACNGLYLDVGVSIGIATAQNENTSDEILRKADVALYKVKDEGGRHFLFYAPSMDAQREERAVLIGELKVALERDEFWLTYQPLVAATGTLCGFEALMRWKHPQHGNIPPSTFIPLAEETGTILALGEWGLRKACAFAATWPDPNLLIAVNISTVQILHSDLVSIVSKALSDFDLEPSRLELEITETAFLETTSDTMDILAKLRDLGVKLALDDFGTGYSSLSYLKKLPVDKIKIDRSFICDLPGVESDVSIVRTIVELGRTLGMVTIAEGVETAEQYECLKRIGCSQIQGYFFGKPASETATLELIENRQQLPPKRAVA